MDIIIYKALIFNALSLYLLSYKSINFKILTKQRRLSNFIHWETSVVLCVRGSVVMLINLLSFCSEIKLYLQNSLNLILFLQRERTSSYKSFLCNAPLL